MFYSGTTKFIDQFFIVCVFFLILCKIITGHFSLKFDAMCLSDSIPLLNIVSSPVFTLLIFLICVIYVYTSKRIQSTNIIVGLVVVFNYYFILNSYTTTVNNVFTTTTSNLTLQNGLLNIHPYIIYQLYGFICVYLFVKMFKTKTYHQYFFNSDLLKKVNLLILVGILLGAWWAAQEFNWGGFWSWDPVELISLLLLLFVLNLQHKNLDNFSTLQLSFYVLLAIVIYCIMRLGLVSTIHSFIKNTSIPYYSYKGFTILVIVVFVRSLQYMVGNQLAGLQTQYSITFYFILLISVLSLFLINLILINFNLLSYYFLFSLNTLYFMLVLMYIVNTSIVKLKFSKYYIVLLTLSYATLYHYTGIYVIFGLVSILLFLTKKNWTLHITTFILYITSVFFFNPLNQNYRSFLSCITCYNMTDQYMNVSVSGLFLNNFFIKKNLFLYTIKSYTHHGLGFITYTKYTLSQFLSFRNNSMLLTYSEEFIFTIIILYILICIFSYNTLIRWDVINY